MKYFFLFLGLLLFSCSSRNEPQINRAGGYPSSIESSVEIIPIEQMILPEPEPLEKALLMLKTDLINVKKYFFTDEDNYIDEGIKVIKKIFVKGICEIEGYEFPVIFDLINSEKIDENLYRIPFMLENPIDGIFYNDELVWTPAQDKSGILLSFDDHYWNIWRQYFYMFENYGAKVTFFVMGNYDLDGAPPFRLSGLKNFCNDTLLHGHDLGYHTLSHPSLNQVSRAEFLRETTEAAASFFNAGIKLSSFAYPYGVSRQWMRDTLVSVFPVTRDYSHYIHLYNTETIGGGYIISASIDNFLYPDDKVFEDDIGFLLLAAKFTGNGILPLSSHIISNTADYGIKPHRLEFLLRTAQELKLNFYTFRNISKMFLN
jgi:peptidoglycan/xylan/chitin deacetylase (PgdA/CDA1 family)